MAGGTWLTQNKVRPGAYINFKGVAKPTSSVGTRGIVTIPLPMSWGEGLVEVLSTDLLDGKSEAKIGYTAFDAESLTFREALKNAYKGLFYRLDTGGVKATATLGDLTVAAKYAGVVGNSIKVAIVENGVKFDILTYYRDVLKNKQTVTDIEDLVSNDWVDFAGTGTLVANAGTPLTGGTDGTISNTTYTTYFNTMAMYKWNTMGVPTDDTDVPPLVKAYIEDLRENKGKKVQAVVYDYLSDYEGIISTKAQGYKTISETISPTDFVAYVAGLTAGSEITQSNTYRVIEGATEIINPLTDDAIITNLGLGHFLLSTRQDGGIVVEQDINSFHEFLPTKGYTFSKNRVIRTLDEINNTVAQTFENNYIGKVNNDDNGRAIFKADIIAYMNQLQTIGAIQNFDSATDIEVLAGDDIDAVVVNLAAQPTDSMEKLYMTVLVG